MSTPDPQPIRVAPYPHRTYRTLLQAIDATRNHPRKAAAEQCAASLGGHRLVGASGGIDHLELSFSNAQQLVVDTAVPLPSFAVEASATRRDTTPLPHETLLLRSEAGGATWTMDRHRLIAARHERVLQAVRVNDWGLLLYFAELPILLIEVLRRVEGGDDFLAFSELD